MSAVHKHRSEEVGFSDQYPEGLGERLAWFAQELGCGEDRLLSLLGLAPSAVPHLSAGGVDWQAVARGHEEEAWWAEGLLFDSLALFNFDIKALRQYLSAPAAWDSPVPGPGGCSLPARSVPATERDRALLTLIAAGGSTGRQALIAYLAQPGDAPPAAP